MNRWSCGEDVQDYFTGQIRLRIKDGYVEASNGNKVSVDAARKTLDFVRRHRSKGWHQNGHVFDVDAFQLDRIDVGGVKIGCTLIQWDEVDRFAKLLKK